MVRFFPVLLAFFSLVLLAGCPKKGDDKITLDKITECFYPDSPKEKAPLWVCGADISGLEIFAVGSSQPSKAGIDYMIQQATLRARASISKQIATKIKTDVTQSLNVATTDSGAPSSTATSEKVETLTVSIVKEMSDETLVGTKPIRQVTNGRGTVYVLVGATRETYEKSLDAAIVASYQQSPGLWNNALGGRTDYETLKQTILKQP